MYQFILNYNYYVQFFFYQIEFQFPLDLDFDFIVVINYYNDTNSSVLLSKIEKSDYCDDYDDCCKKLLKKYETYPDQDINECYNKMNTSYNYECLYKDENLGNSGLIIFCSLFGLGFIVLILYIYKYHIYRKMNYNRMADYGSVND